jgi:hypothetical protein
MAMRQRHGHLAGLLLALLLAGCTWVELSPEARRVRVADADEVGECEHLGVASVATLASFGLFDRYAKSIEEELSALARGSAVQLGGNTIVPLGGIVDGRRSYAVYRCPETDSSAHGVPGLASLGTEGSAR